MRLSSGDEREATPGLPTGPLRAPTLSRSSSPSGTSKPCRAFVVVRSPPGPACEQVLHQPVGRGEEHRASGFHQPVAQGAQGMGLAGAGQSEGHPRSTNLPSHVVACRRARGTRSCSKDPKSPAGSLDAVRSRRCGAASGPRPPAPALGKRVPGRRHVRRAGESGHRLRSLGDGVRDWKQACPCSGAECRWPSGQPRQQGVVVAGGPKSPGRFSAGASSAACNASSFLA